MHPPDNDIIAFRPDKTRSVESDETYTGNPANYDELFSWIQAKCVPLVREITFENAEELTEEGLIKNKIIPYKHICSNFM